MHRGSLRAVVALAVVCSASSVHAERGGKKPASGQVLVAPRTFVDTKRWTCLVGPSGDVYCSMRTYPDFWPAPTVPATGFGFEKVSGLAEVTALDATGEYVCSLDAHGAVQCWGCLYSLCRLWPKRIALAGPARQVVVENSGACALLQSGAVQCWGASQSGQLGKVYNPPILTEEPVTVPLSGKAKQLAATTDARCALDERGYVTCWGNVCRGQSERQDLKPRRMPQLEQVSAIAANVSFTCAVSGPERAVRCWGHSDFGQTSMEASRGAPHRDCEIGTVRNLEHVKQLALGYLSGAALTDEGALYYWGQSHYGGARQLGHRIDPQVRVELDRDFSPAVGPDPQPHTPRRFDQEPVRVAADLVVRRAIVSGNYVCLELEGAEVLCEWTLSKTPFHIEEVWPAVRFDSGMGSSP